MHLKDKITSNDQLLTVTEPRNLAYHHWSTSGEKWILNSSIFATVVEGARAGHYTTEHVPKENWWLAREWLRCEHKVYPEPSEVLKHLQLNPLLSQYVPHVSQDDPLMIAFTASVSDGQADKQTRTTLGKFLRKYGFMLTDAYIQQLDAEHRADMLAEIELLPPSEFKWAYMNGPSSCMSHQSDYWHLPKDIHPLDAYDAPGFHLAVIRKAKTEEGISARCVVWHNPADPNDKRAIRVYGDSALKRRLLKNGYKFTHFVGAKIRAVPVKAGTKPDKAGAISVAMPYLDGIDGSGSDGYQCVRRADGFLHILSNADGAKLSSLVPGSVLVGRVQGKIDVQLFPEDKLTYRCGATGESCDVLTDPPTYFYTPDPGVIQVSTAWLKKLDQEKITRVKVYSADHGEFRSCWVVIDQTPTFSASGTWLLDGAQERKLMGFHQLDPALYPDRQDDWLRLEEVAIASEVNEAGEVTRAQNVVVLQDDSVRVATRELGAVMVHKNAVPSSAVRVADLDGQKCYAAPGADFVVTDSGRKVLPNYHEVVQLHTGVWTYKRNAVSVQLGHLGSTWVLKKDFKDWVQPIVPDWITKRMSQVDGTTGQRVWLFLRSCHSIDVIASGTMVRANPGVPPIQTWKNLVDYVRLVLSFAGKSPEQIQAEYPGTDDRSAHAAHALAANAMTVFTVDQANLAAERAAEMPPTYFPGSWTEVPEGVSNESGSESEAGIRQVNRAAQVKEFFDEDNDSYTDALAVRVTTRSWGSEWLRVDDVTVPVITLVDPEPVGAEPAQQPEPVAA